MNETLYTPRELAKFLGVTTETLKQWAEEGKIRFTKTSGGHRRYIYTKPINCTNQQCEPSKKAYIYARVSSGKQKNDLERQVQSLQSKFPTHHVIKDIGSGINFKRKGLVSLLDQVISGNVSEVVVAHRDRLCRFGFEMFSFLFNRYNVSLQVLSDEDVEEPINTLAKDLLSIVTVFTARYYGARKYTSDVLQKNKNIPKRRTSNSLQQVHRRIKVFLQPSSSSHQ